MTIWRSNVTHSGHTPLTHVNETPETAMSSATSLAFFE